MSGTPEKGEERSLALVPYFVHYKYRRLPTSQHMRLDLQVACVLMYMGLVGFSFSPLLSVLVVIFTSG